MFIWKNINTIKKFGCSECINVEPQYIQIVVRFEVFQIKRKFTELCETVPPEYTYSESLQS